jgi:hypothetical protein
MKPLELMTHEDVANIVWKAVPEIAEDVLSRVNENSGTSEIRSIKPITKLLTLILEDDVSAAIESALIQEMSDHQASLKIDFIKACAHKIDYESFMYIMQVMTTAKDNPLNYDVYANNYKSVWNILNLDCFRDGALFLETVKAGLWDPDDETAELFLAFYEIQ